MLEYLDKIFKLGAQLATATHNTGVQSVAATIMQQPDAFLSGLQTDFLACFIRQLTNLTKGVGLATGHVMSFITIGSQQFWLRLTALQRKD